MCPRIPDTVHKFVQGYRILFTNLSKDTGYCSQICPRMDIVQIFVQGYRILFTNLSKDTGCCSQICPRIPDIVHKLVQVYRILFTNLSNVIRYRLHQLVPWWPRTPTRCTTGFDSI